MHRLREAVRRKNAKDVMVEAGIFAGPHRTARHGIRCFFHSPVYERVDDSGMAIHCADRIVARRNADTTLSNHLIGHDAKKMAAAQATAEFSREETLQVGVSGDSLNEAGDRLKDQAFQPQR